MKKILQRVLVAGACWLTAVAWALEPAAPLPADSLYVADIPLRDQDGRDFALRDLAGKPLLIAMFYGNCRQVCPIVIEGVKGTVATLDAEQRKKLSVLLVSFDPQADTPAALQHLLQMHELDPALFRLAVSDSEAHTRTLAALLGVRYRRLADGSINHTARVLLLDAAGRPAFALDGATAVPDPGLLQALRDLLKQP